MCVNVARESPTGAHLAALTQTAAMEPAFWIALVAILVAIRIAAARQVAKGRRRFVWLVFAPMLVAQTIVVIVAIRLLATQPLAAMGLSVLVIPSLVFYVRMINRMASDARASEGPGELSSAGFDYIIGVSIGLPFVLVVLLLALLITGGLGGSM